MQSVPPTVGATIGRQSHLYSYYFTRVSTKRFFISHLFQAASVCYLFFNKRKKQPASTMDFFSFFKYWKIATKEYKHLETGLLLFALFNSSDVFLLLKTEEIIGGSTVNIFGSLLVVIQSPLRLVFFTT